MVLAVVTVVVSRGVTSRQQGKVNIFGLARGLETAGVTFMELHCTLTILPPKEE
jgi:hypothetical protein